MRNNTGGDDEHDDGNCIRLAHDTSCEIILAMKMNMNMMNIMMEGAYTKQKRYLTLDQTGDDDDESDDERCNQTKG